MIKEVSYERSRYGFKNLIIGSAVALIVLVNVTLYGYIKLKETKQTTQWVTHTQNVITYMTRLQALLFENGANQRGHIITGQDRYFEAFEKMALVIDETIDNLQAKTIDNKVQQSNIREIRQLIEKRRAWLRKTMALVNEGKRNEAISLVKTGTGQDYMDAIKRKLDIMTALEKKLLAQQIEGDAAARSFANTIVSGGSIFAILILLIALYFISKEFGKRIQIQRALNDTMQIQQAMLRATSMALIAGDTDGKITLFNPAAEWLLGYKADEMLGKSPALFHKAEEVAARAETLSKRFGEIIPVGFEVFVFRARRNIIESDQWTYVRKDGSEVQVNLTISPMRDPEGKVTGFIGLAYDITQQLEYERAMIAAKNLALAGTKAKSEFLANMSHEIRTPMNAIMGMAELLNETKLDEEQRKYVEIFQRSGESLLGIINDILDLSKIEVGHLELDHISFKLSHEIQKCAEIMAVRAHQKQLELAVDIDGRLPDDFEGDPNRLRQIILNLLGNAVKFTKRGEIVLRVKGRPTAEAYELSFEIQDTGIGMAADHQKRLFDRFHQADTSITREFGGTGLGLNISKRLVELMGGNISVQSSLGVGTKFTFIIQLKHSSQTELDSSPVVLIGKRVLVVDDTRTNRMILKKIMEQQGADVFDVDNGDEAIRLVEGEKNAGRPFHLILMDCRMPGLDGFATAEKVLNTPALSGPIIMMLTSDNRPGDLARSKKLGLAHYLVKPILKRELLEGIGFAFHGPTSVPTKVEVTSSASGTHLTILLVDDNDENRVVIRSFLKTQPWRIDEAKNGQEALDLFQSRSYDLILMDMQMPVMDGYTATREIRKLEQQNGTTPLPIFALTAHALKEEMEKSFSAGCTGHLTKPISKAELLKVINASTSAPIVNIDPDLKDLIPEYLANRKREVAELEQFLQQEDFAKLQAIGHKLRGAAGSYGFNDLSEVGKIIEESSKTKDSNSIRNALRDYRHYLDKVKVNYQ